MDINFLKDQILLGSLIDRGWDGQNMWHIWEVKEMQTVF